MESSRTIPSERGNKPNKVFNKPHLERGNKYVVSRAFCCPSNGVTVGNYYLHRKLLFIQEIRRRNRARLLLFHDRFAVIFKKTHFSPQISNKILKSQKKNIISYHSHRNFLLPQIIKNLLRLRSRFRKGRPTSLSLSRSAKSQIKS
jgi:hypothetical protein